MLAYAVFSRCTCRRDGDLRCGRLVGYNETVWVANNHGGLLCFFVFLECVSLMLVADLWVNSDWLFSRRGCK